MKMTQSTELSFTPNGRQTRLLEMIMESGFAETEAAARAFAKTTQTIRRDFDLLEKHGLIRRVHGGASAPSGHQNRPYAERQLSRRNEKDRIGRSTAGIIPHGKCVFLSLGTSTEAVARHLVGHEDMHFITNNLNIANVLLDNESSDLTLCGGQVRRSDSGLIDHRAIELIANFRFDFGVIGAGAISDTGDLFCYSIDEARMAQAIIANSEKIILVADDKKIGQTANFKLADLNSVHVFVTDGEQAPDIKTLCDENRVDLIVA